MPSPHETTGGTRCSPLPATGAWSNEHVRPGVSVSSVLRSVSRTNVGTNQPWPKTSRNRSKWTERWPTLACIAANTSRTLTELAPDIVRESAGLLGSTRREKNKMLTGQKFVAEPTPTHSTDTSVGAVHCGRHSIRLCHRIRAIFSHDPLATQMATPNLRSDVVRRAGLGVARDAGRESS